MQNLVTQYPTQLEQDLVALHNDSVSSKEWFYESVLATLENQNLTSFAKSDRIADALMNLDAKIDYIKEQQKLLASLKKQLEVAKSNGKEQVSKALSSMGVAKLEGLKISSITVSKATDKSKAQLEILDEKSLIQAGFFSVILDTEAVEKALLSADQRHEVQDYADMSISLIHKPATIRINKRKSLSDELTQIENAA